MTKATKTIYKELCANNHHKGAAKQIAQDASNGHALAVDLVTEKLLQAGYSKQAATQLLAQAYAEGSENR